MYNRVYIYSKSQKKNVIVIPLAEFNVKYLTFFMLGKHGRKQLLSLKAT